MGDAAAPAASPSPPPSSREVLRSMSQTLQAAQQISFHVELDFDEVLYDGQKVQYAGAADVKLRKPNGLSVDYRDDLSARQLWYDGKSLTLYDPGAGVYATAAAPPDVEQAVDQFERDYGVFLPLSEIVIGNPYQKVVDLALSGKYLGIHDVDGTPCYHVAFVGENLDFQLWVEQGEKAVPRKMVVTYKREEGSPQYVAELMDWNLHAKLPDSDFEKRVPADAVATQFLAIEDVKR